MGGEVRSAQAQRFCLLKDRREMWAVVFSANAHGFKAAASDHNHGARMVRHMPIRLADMTGGANRGRSGRLDSHGYSGAVTRWPRPILGKASTKADRDIARLAERVARGLSQGIAVHHRKPDG